MKFFSKYLSLAAVAVATGASLTSCQNDFDLPPIDEPKATMEANTTISALKTQYWQDDQNYFLTVGTNAEGADVIVRGRVVSSDATGNIYKSLVIQDETGALAFSINQTGLNNSYRVGQEIVVNSSHHQAVRDLGQGLYKTAWDENGVVEALQHGSLPIWTVQFHPEQMTGEDGGPVGQKIFDFFLEQCRKNLGC